MRATVAAACLLVAGTQGAIAVTCTTQAQMTNGDRAEIAEAARQLATLVQAADVAGVKALTVPSVAASFDGIAQGIQSVSGPMRGATLTVETVYGLDASDAKPGDQETQFFCGGGEAAGHVIFTIPELPPGRYAFALLHATGVKQPQQIGMLLSRQQRWELAGFFPRPLTSAGHDGLWYWTRARAYAQKKQNWNAYFYGNTAVYLLTPVNFLSSSNLEKLLGEQEAVKPQGLPGATPMTVAANGQSYSVTAIRTDDALGGLDLVLRYAATDNSDPAAARSRTVGLMTALLAEHPELREAFHGLWVFADAPSGPPFGLELPMTDIH